MKRRDNIYIQKGQMGISPAESFVILYHEDMAAARAFYMGLLGLEVRQVVYDCFIILALRISKKRRE